MSDYIIYKGELYHYGVLGMKWGVRRDREKNTHTIPKGTKIYRSTVNPNESREGSKYVTYLKVDRDYYKSDEHGGGFIKNTSNGKDLYEKEYTLEKDLKVAGREHVRSAIDNLYTNDRKKIEDIVRKDQFDLMTKDKLSFLDYVKPGLLKVYGVEKGTKMYEREVQHTIDIGKERVNNLMDSGVLDKPFDRFVLTTQTFGANPEIKNKVIQELKKQGFNSMVDEASVGSNKHGRVGVDPLIIFDSKETLRDSKTTKISNAAALRAKRRYQKWVRTANRRGYKDERRGLSDTW